MVGTRMERLSGKETLWRRNNNKELKRKGK